MIKKIVEGVEQKVPSWMGYLTFFRTQINPTRPKSPTTVTAAAVKAPEIAAAKVKVATTRITMSASAISTIGFANMFLAIHNTPPYCDSHIYERLKI
jgi:hypothetical protein